MEEDRIKIGIRIRTYIERDIVAGIKALGLIKEECVSLLARAIPSINSIAKAII